MILQRLIRYCTACLIVVAAPAMAQAPISSIELLRSIKSSLDRDVLVKPEALTEDNLKRIFGAQRIVWDKRNTANLVMVEALDMARVVPDVHVGNIKMDGIGISIKRSVNPNGKVKTELFLLFRNKAEALPYQAVMQVFDSAFTRTTPLPSPHRIMGSPIDANSNSEFTSTKESGAIRETVVLSFRSNSTLSEATFVESEWP